MKTVPPSIVIMRPISRPAQSTKHRDQRLLQSRQNVRPVARPTHETPSLDFFALAGTHAILGVIHGAVVALPPTCAAALSIATTHARAQRVATRLEHDLRIFVDRNARKECEHMETS